MIFVGNIREVSRGEYDEVWAIVQKFGGKSDWIEQVKQLAPDEELFHTVQFRELLGHKWPSIGDALRAMITSLLIFPTQTTNITDFAVNAQLRWDFIGVPTDIAGSSYSTRCVTGA